MIIARWSQPCGPKTAARGWCLGWGLNQRARMGPSLAEDSVSLVTYASICRLSWERSETVEDNGRRRSSIVRSAEFLKAQMRWILGVVQFASALLKMSSRMMDIEGVIPLPPLIRTRELYLNIRRRIELVMINLCEQIDAEFSTR